MRYSGECHDSLTFGDVVLGRPDLLINPHAFPSRMTIGMLIESLVSKAGAMAGKFMNATPFQKAAGHYQEPISSVADTLEQFGFHRNGGTLFWIVCVSSYH